MEGGPPEFETDELTGLQQAMLKLLGEPPVISSIRMAFYVDAESEREGAPSIAPAHVMHHRCPLVEVLGLTRAILPNGDLWEHRPSG